MSEGVLTGVRVLDLANERAELTGRLLADLGAEVLKIEPAAGTAARKLPPFDERPGHEGRSLYWAATGLNKKSAVLDIEEASGRETLLGLVGVADIFIESFDPGYLNTLGLNYEALAVINPRLIYVSVSAYGQTGPKANWPASELTIEAAGGRLSMQGDRDRRPLPVGHPQAAYHAGAQAAADAVIALNERDVSGLGQWLDTSAQAAMIWTLMGPGQYPSALGIDPPGAGDDRGSFEPPGMQKLMAPNYPCKDGYVIVILGPGASGSPGLIPVLMEDLRQKGEMPDGLAEIDWQNWAPQIADGSLSEELLGEAIGIAKEFMLTMTKQEIVKWGIENDQRFAPVHTTRDLLEEVHLRARGFWTDVDGEIYPGATARLSRTPITYERPAPGLGEHQELIDEWLKIELAKPKAPATPRSGFAFEGLKVADFSWVAAGPTMGKALADNGADVIKIESSLNVDLARALPPFVGGELHHNKSMWTALYNTSKRSMTLDLRKPEGIDIARKMIAWADVMIESFSPGTMQRFGLDYGSISGDRPDLIMLSTSLLGQTGPYRRYSGYGQHGSAFGGIYSTTGWPDRPPCGAAGPYTDVIAPKFGISALAGAIYERRRTGLGQYIDVSQIECSIHFIEPLLLDEAVNGRTAEPIGMFSPIACPYGVYATLEQERYIAISTVHDDQWAGLVSCVELGEFADLTLDERLEVSDDIDRVLGDWCAARPCFEAEAVLIAAGVPASVVARPTDFHRDPQIAHRNFYVELEQAEVGPLLHDGPATHFSARRVPMRTAYPSLGQHTDEVLTEVLKLDKATIERLTEAGALL